jgi:hypothetical protein
MAGTAFSSLIRQVRQSGLLELPSLSTPATPTVTPQGTTGATSYSYKVVARNRDQRSIASAAGSTTTGNAALSSTNFNRVAWTAVTGATFYEVHRTVGGATTGIVAIVGAVLQLDDTGLVGDASTAPTAATGGTFWTDDELVDHLTNGCNDLWAAILDLHAEHYLTVDITNVSLAANATQLTGVPATCFRVHHLGPRDTTSEGSSRGIIFTPRKFNSPDFQNALTRSAMSSTSINEIFYSVSGEGSPVAAPVILTAPKVDTAINLRLAYNPTLAALTIASTNPIPGFSDQALVSYAIAYARAKERDDRSPDPNWIASYGTEKMHILTRLTPRQSQEPDVVEGVFEGY